MAAMIAAMEPSTTGDAPYYLPVGDEVEMFTAAFAARLPVLLKGPTGCGKTRFVEYMAWRLGHELRNGDGPALITVACHEDLTASDLVGRYLLEGDETVWIDGPLTRAVRAAPSATSTRSSRRARTPPSSSTR